MGQKAPSLLIHKPQTFKALLEQVKLVDKVTIEKLHAAEKLENSKCDLAKDVETFKKKVEEANFLGTVAFDKGDAVLEQVSTLISIASRIVLTIRKVGAIKLSCAT